MKRFSMAGMLALPFLMACGAHVDEPTVAAITQAASAAGTYTYTFDPSGLVTSVGTNGAAYNVARQGDTLSAGSSRYRFDALGRVDAIDDLALAYGPDGQVDHATNGGRTTSFVYDEEGHRILKKVNGAPTTAYVDESTISETELAEPVKVGGRVIGLLRNGQFTMVATDTRGTALADGNGAQRLPSPFGARPVHADVAAIIDYAEHGFDTDLGVNRMGVRDYDARIARFLSPDPLFLEHPEKCIESPVECSLYGYAKSNPLSYVDPTGLGADDPYIDIGAAGGFAGGFVFGIYITAYGGIFPYAGYGVASPNVGIGVALGHGDVSPGWSKVETGSIGPISYSKTFASSGPDDPTPGGPVTATEWGLGKGWAPVGGAASNVKTFGNIGRSEPVPMPRWDPTADLRDRMDRIAAENPSMFGGNVLAVDAQGASIYDAVVTGQALSSVGMMTGAFDKVGIANVQPIWTAK